MKKIILPGVILLISIFIITIIVATKPEPPTKAAERVISRIEVIQAVPQEHQLSVSGYGTVMAGVHTVLAAEVSGRVVEITPAFKDGQFFKNGDVLLKIDDADYKAAYASAQANAASAKLQYDQEIARSMQARKDWERLGRAEQPTDLTLRKPQLEFAKATYESAVAALEKTKRDLDRTVIRAPYDGRVERTSVDLGHYLNMPGATVATIYSTDYVEVRIPLTDRELSQLHLPKDGTLVAEHKVKAILSANVSRQQVEWEGKLERVEAVIDLKTRMQHVVVRVDDPYGKSPPLKPGQFVGVEIQGRKLKDVFVLPRSVLVDHNQVMTVGDESKLFKRDIILEKSAVDSVVVSDGLKKGDYISITPLEYAIDGMPVKYSVAVDKERK